MVTQNSINLVASTKQEKKVLKDDTVLHTIEWKVVSNSPFYWFTVPTIPEMWPCVTSFPLKFLAQVLFILSRGFCLRPVDKRSCLGNRKCFLCGLSLVFLPPTAQLHVNKQDNKIMLQKVTKAVDALNDNNFRWPWCNQRETWTKCMLKRVCSQAYAQNSCRNAGYRPFQTNKKRKCEK